MKKANTIVDNTSDKTLTVYYQEALSDPDFIKLITKLKIKENIAKRYTTKLESTVEDLKRCKGCKGLNSCKNKINGFVYYPRVVDNNLIFDYVSCKFKKEELESINTKTSMFNEPNEIKKARMSLIDLTDKKRKETILWINNFYKNYQNDKNIKGLYLHGSFGSGKTFMIAALLNELAEKGSSSVIIYYPELLRSLKESFDSNNNDFANMMDKIKTCDLLLIDDLGAENLTNWNRDEILSTILQYRMDSKLPTFITSNLNINELEYHLSKGALDTVKAKRIIERIKQLTEDIELISENRRK